MRLMFIEDAKKNSDIPLLDAKYSVESSSWKFPEARVASRCRHADTPTKRPVIAERCRTIRGRRRKRHSSIYRLSPTPSSFVATNSAAAEIGKRSPWREYHKEAQRRATHTTLAERHSGI
ncbi:hypothetical protein AVEN_140383-1 [Araneus ventricosus]|uniref:Uncharacterized protein n=1 Tax=Araneus ventricosus TaxID=182803 RepID=A0A4Y2L680_ARAVE|nr:hypothetical protein AVEN_140383-1 [Araneus ventricosus]